VRGPAAVRLPAAGGQLHFPLLQPATAPPPPPPHVRPPPALPSLLPARPARVYEVPPLAPALLLLLPQSASPFSGRQERGVKNLSF
jgi:hypothetical protein